MSTNENIEGSVVAFPEETADDECRRLRQELETSRRNREKQRELRCDELKLLEYRYRTKKESLKRNLRDRTNVPTYRQSLLRFQQEEFGQRDGSGQGDDGTSSKNNSSNIFRNGSRIATSSNYILQKETPLLSAMHRSFLVLPNQIEVLEGEYERKIYPYFRDEIRSLNVDLLEVSDYWMRRLSEKVEENKLLYDSYQTKLEGMEAEIRKHKTQLHAIQRKGRNKNESFTTVCDEETILSGTESDSDSDNDSSLRPDAGVGFLKLLFLSTSPQTTTSERSSSNVSNSMHDPIRKRRNAFQTAATKFRLPFGLKEDVNDHDSGYKLVAKEL
mmetsp:Transcript_22237/g.52611  ORF Transcript_22237/g.52611 Transcript_22237/m.52611 type:complete len:330 (+) Transcript_22237:31-1020(+)